MNETEDQESKINEYIFKFRNILVIGFSAYMLTWCAALLITNSSGVQDWLSNLGNVDTINSYKRVMFTIIPMSVGCILGLTIKPKNPYVPTILLLTAVIIYLIVY